MHNIAVESKSRKELRELAHSFKDKFKLKNPLKFPVVQLLDVLPDMFPNFSYEILEDDKMPSNIHASTDLNGHIIIRQSVYLRACDGEGRDRMTIAHEIAHFLMLCVHNFKWKAVVGQISTYQDPEWQAKCFAGELMIDSRLVAKMDALDIEINCGVSRKAAEYQLQKYKEDNLI